MPKTATPKILLPEEKQKIRKKRMDVVEIKNEVRDDGKKFFDRPEAARLQELPAMLAAKLAINEMTTKAGNQNMVKAYLRDHFRVSGETAESLILKAKKGTLTVEMWTETVVSVEMDGEKWDESLPAKAFPVFLQMVSPLIKGEKAFEVFKKDLVKIISGHPLVHRMSGIKGLTAYQIGIMMAYIRDPKLYATPGHLASYAGVSGYKGVGMTKASLKGIQEMYHQEGREKRGYNTAFQGRILGTIVPSMLKNGPRKPKGAPEDAPKEGGSKVYHLYQRIRNGLIERAKQERLENGQPKVFVATKEDVRESGGKMKEGRTYMTGHKNHSLEMWSHQNAVRRIARILLYHVQTEWLALMGIKNRMPYPMEYLGHTSFISLDELKDVLDASPDTDIDSDLDDE